MSAPVAQELVAIANGVAAVAINALWQDALLVLGVWALLRAWPHLNASTRYTVWSATLVAAVLVPVATTVPFITAPPPPVSSHEGADREARTPILTPGTVAGRHTEPSVANGAGGGVAGETLPRVSPLRFPERFRLTLPVPLVVAVAVVWALLAGLALVRLAIGIVKLEALKRDALPLPVDYRDAMSCWESANKGSRDVRLCVSDDTDVPVAVGLFDSMILIPRVLLEQLSEAEVDQISLHELAHLRRADDWTNGLQRVVLALLAWNPAAAFIGRQLDLEREVACDDWVLSLTGAVRPYALCLTKMAETASWPRSPMPAPGVFATRKHISLRIERLLGKGRNIATTLAVGPAAAAVAIVGALAFVIAVVAPSIAAPAAAPDASSVAEAVPATATLPTAAPKRAQSHAQAASAYARSAEAYAKASPAAAAAPAAPATAPVSPARAPRERVVVFIKNDAAASASTPAVPVLPVRPLPAPSAPTIDVNDAQLQAEASRLASSSANAGLSAAHGVLQSLAKNLSPTALAQNGAPCVNCDFTGVDWSGRDLHGASYAGTDFSHAKLRGVNFTGGRFDGVDFKRSDLHGATFRNAQINGVDFTGADLGAADFTGASLHGDDFSGTNLASATVRSFFGTCTGCDFSHANLSGTDLSGLTIGSVDFSHADLRNANLAGATINETDLSGARLDHANLDGTTFKNCDMSGIDLTNVDLSKAHLIGVDLSQRRPHS